MLGAASGGNGQERRINASVFLARLTAADGAWLNQILPTLQHGVRARADAVRVEDVVLRHRPGRLGIADAMDATAEILRPFRRLAQRWSIAISGISPMMTTMMTPTTRLLLADWPSLSRAAKTICL